MMSKSKITPINENNKVSSRQEIYNMFVNYFNNPFMTKKKNINNEYTMYVCKAYCLLSNECRYIVAIVNNDIYPVDHVNKLSDLKWVSFQTRTLKEQYSSESHSYTPIAKGPLTASISRIEQNEEASTYSCTTIPILVTLLHTEKKTKDSYQPNGTIIAALETWETIITFE